MTNTQEAFDRWCKDVGKNVYMKLAPKDICSEAWKACQAHNDAVIAELVEALERLDGWLEARHLGGLMPNEKALIAKHKKDTE